MAWVSWWLVLAARENGKSCHPLPAEGKARSSRLWNFQVRSEKTTMMAVTSQSPFAPSEGKKKIKERRVKTQSCFAKIICELGWHGNSQVSCTNPDLRSICVVRIFISNPYLLEDFWLLADHHIKTLHFWHVYTRDFSGSFEMFVSVTKERKNTKWCEKLGFTTDWIVKHPNVRRYLESSALTPVGIISSDLRR